MGTAIKGLGMATTAAAVGIGKIASESLNAYASFEQLTGGVETLFGAGGQTLDEYAAAMGHAEGAADQWASKMRAQEKVMENARNAYKTAGMSANEYMETVTGFSASLIQSLGGDTEKAAEIADKAITDMSDNANKMGTSMESIQNAYQGFAKQNYTMLDNLKLGYGGTKSEMERLLKDAEKLTGIEYNIENYADVVEAIHAIQNEMGITGTTAKEAASTIEGSMNMMKASWQNLLIGFGDEKADLGKLVDEFIDSAFTVLDNVLPRVETIIERIADGVGKLLPKLLDRLPGLLQSFLPGLIDAAVGAVTQLVDTIAENLPQLVDTLVPPLIKGAIKLVAALVANLPKIISGLIKSIPSIITAIIEGFAGAMPDLIGGITGVLGALWDAISGLLGEAIEFWVELFGGSVEAIQEAWSGIVDFFGGIWEGITGAFSSAGEWFGEKFSEAKEMATAAWDGITDFFGGVWDGISGAFEGAADWFGNKFESAKEMTQNAWSNVKGFFADSWEGIKGTFSTVGGWFSDRFSEAKSGIMDNFSAAGDFLGNTWTNIKEKFGDAKSKFLDIGKNIITGIKEGITGAVTGLYDSIKSVGSNILNKFKGVLGIHSPSKEFEYLANMCVAGFEGPLEDINLDDTTAGIEASLSNMENGIQGAQLEANGGATASLSNSVNVYLEGEAAGIFKVVRTENENFIKSAGFNPLLA